MSKIKALLRFLFVSFRYHLLNIWRQRRGYSVVEGYTPQEERIILERIDQLGYAVCGASFEQKGLVIADENGNMSLTDMGHNRLHFLKSPDGGAT